jgi:hypothetical protein
MAEVRLARGVPGVGRNRDGRLEVFVRGSDDAVWRIAQRAPNNGWGSWEFLGGRFEGNPVVGTNADGRLEVFARGFNYNQPSAITHIWQTVDGWSQWTSRGGLFRTDPVVGSNADGRLEVFAYDKSDHLQHIWQTCRRTGWQIGKDGPTAVRQWPATPMVGWRCLPVPHGPPQHPLELVEYCISGRLPPTTGGASGPISVVASSGASLSWVVMPTGASRCSPVAVVT